ncbi:MarR family winged helix-turn-helix transcriptional regulator [Streptomyces candidus]|uniref:DNA-binding MarR family transcriptional regulator n=1 Tax=Streptomyces candidus TaxID=67283 RepID=A0A7X0HP88_9ACTN|nr:MarR family winged helix-turn-helix transcriptional regulator [Streptomyces candidus]MBB6440089.1 DNA-binding MarR family transcriptional regulator [Streptomyces candidus]GHH43988.1 MarR family transcriptional regulator [Streptomyces candidus]
MPQLSASAQDIDHMATGLVACLPALSRALDRRIGQEFPHPKPPEGQLALLRYVQANEGVTVRQTAQALLMKPNNVSALVSQLTERGLLERRQDPADKRVAHLYVTATAQQRVAEADRLMCAHVTQALLAMTDGERGALGSALGALHTLSLHLHHPAG